MYRAVSNRFRAGGLRECRFFSGTTAKLQKTRPIDNLPNQLLYPDSPIKVVLVDPCIPNNAGNIARLCAALKIHLILVGDLGFALNDKKLKRAGLDYWEFVSFEHFPDKVRIFILLVNKALCAHLCNQQERFFQELIDKSAVSPCFHMLSVHAEKCYTKLQPKNGDYLLFGSETKGLPKSWYAPVLS